MTLATTPATPATAMPSSDSDKRTMFLTAALRFYNLLFLLVRLNNDDIIVVAELERGSSCIIYGALYLFGKVACKYVEKGESALEAKREIKMLRYYCLCCK